MEWYIVVMLGLLVFYSGLLTGWIIRYTSEPKRRRRVR